MRIQVREEIVNAAAYDRILVNSLYSRESVLRAYGLDSEVCYLGVDPGRFNQERWPGDFLITVGALVGEKNPLFLARCIADRRGKKLPWIWVANYVDDGVRDDLLRFAQLADVDLRIEAKVSDSELARLLAGATLMVYSPRLEPFGLAPLEAAAAGLAIVAVGEGGVRESVVDGETGVLTASSTSLMAAAIDRLVEAPDERARLGSTGRDHVRSNWSTGAAVDRLELAIKATAAGAP